MKDELSRSMSLIVCHSMLDSSQEAIKEISHNFQILTFIILLLSLKYIYLMWSDIKERNP